MFNDLVTPPTFLRSRAEALDAANNDERRALLAREALDETAALPADLGQSGYDVVPTRGSHPPSAPGQQQGVRND